MSDHLTPDQFAKCFVNGAEGLELRHITECPRCSDELDRFGSAVASFRSTGPDRRSCRVRWAGSFFIPSLRSSASGSQVSLGLGRGGSCSDGFDPSPDDQDATRGRHR